MKKNKIHTISIKTLLPLILIATMIISCEKDVTYEQTRLFRPVLNVPLSSQGNTIIVNIGIFKGSLKLYDRIE